MPRKRDPEVVEAEEKLGLEAPGGHRTLAEQKARVAKKKDEKASLALAAEAAGAIELRDEAIHGLTERQIQILKLSLRGFPQTLIANVVKVSQPTVSIELKKIREHMKARGGGVDQELVVGRSLTVYDDVQQKAYDLYHTSDDPSNKLKSLQIMLQSEKDRMKLLMDLGLVERAAQEVNHNLVQPSKFVEAWNTGQVQKAARALLEAGFTPLEEPKPPDSDVIDAEYSDSEEVDAEDE